MAEHEMSCQIAYPNCICLQCKHDTTLHSGDTQCCFKHPLGCGAKQCDDFEVDESASKPVVSNGDRIRAMSDEVLGRFLCDLFTSTEDQDCVFCPAYKMCYEGHTGFVDWLKNEADNTLLG